MARKRQATRTLLQGITSRFNTANERLQLFGSAIEERPDGVVPNAGARRGGLPTALNADTFAAEIGLIVAADATVALNGLHQRQTVTLDEAEEESRQIDHLVQIFSDLSAQIPRTRQHFGSLWHSTQQTNNDINPPSTLSGFRVWNSNCAAGYRSLNTAFVQLNNNLLSFARNLRRQGGTLPFVTTHGGRSGERYSPTGLLSNVPDIANTR